MVKGFSKVYNFSFFGQIFFCKHFYYITGFCDRIQILNELSNDVSFVIFGHQTWDLEFLSNPAEIRLNHSAFSFNKNSKFLNLIPAGLFLSNIDGGGPTPPMTLPLELR